MKRIVCLFLFSWAFISGAALAAETQITTSPDYVGTPVCTGCHETEAASWRTSHHAHAWMEPAPETVDGDFEDAIFTLKGKTSRFFKRHGGYFIETDDVPGEKRIFKVVGVDGIAPLQQYLVETKPGRLQSFDVVWDQERKRWYHLYGDGAPPPRDGLHWTGPYKNWNGRCAECHATGFQKNYEEKERQYSSRQAEIGVGCEACHGPGEAHTAWAKHPEGYVSPFNGTDQAGLLIDFSKGQQQTEVQQCAGCHSRREPFDDRNPLPGTPFHDAYRLSLLRPGLYYPDGQILDEVYVYGSFLQSKMHAKGVRCSNCHDPHSGRLKSEGSGVCTQCHSPAANPGFPSLSMKLYDDPSHHFHEAGTEGAQCKSCHMIERVYMGTDGRRDHSFRVPRPDLSAKLDTPNACNDCHKDKSADWAANEIASRFPDSIHRGQHYGEVFSGAQKDPAGFDKELIAIAETPSFPGIARATALDLLLSRASSEIAARAEPLLHDEDPLVRAAAVTLQRAAEPADKLQRIVGSLEDPVKSVRIAAAREMLSLPIVHLPSEIEKAAISAQKEWQDALSARLDFPETHMVIGGMALVQRNPKAALAAFAEVTQMDPQMISAWVMQVRILIAVRDQISARQVLRSALNRNPEDSILLGFKQQLGM